MKQLETGTFLCVLYTKVKYKRIEECLPICFISETTPEILLKMLKHTKPGLSKVRPSGRMLARKVLICLIHFPIFNTKVA
jgi:hypothetical protein